MGMYVCLREFTLPSVVQELPQEVCRRNLSLAIWLGPFGQFDIHIVRDDQLRVFVCWRQKRLFLETVALSFGQLRDYCIWHCIFLPALHLQRGRPWQYRIGPCTLGTRMKPLWSFLELIPFSFTQHRILHLIWYRRSDIWYTNMHWSRALFILELQQLEILHIFNEMECIVEFIKPLNARGLDILRRLLVAGNR